MNLPVNQIRGCAKNIARKLAIDDIDALAEDLEMAGWIAYLSDKQPVELKEKMSRARSAMIDAWCRWRFGVSRGNIARDEPIQVADFDTIEAGDYSVEDVILGQNLYQKLKAALEKRERRKGKRFASPRKKMTELVRYLDEVILPNEGAGRVMWPIGWSKAAAARRLKIVREEFTKILAA